MKKVKKVFMLSLISIFVLSLILTQTGYTYAHKSITNNDIFDLDVNSLRLNHNSNYNIKFIDDDSFTLGDSVVVPKIYADAAKYGIIFSNTLEAKKKFREAIIDISKSKVNNDSEVVVEAAVSMDGTKWTEWFSAEESKNYTIDYLSAYKFLKYRITLISYSKESNPIINKISVKLKGISEEEQKMLDNKKFFDGNTQPKENRSTNVQIENSPDLANINAATNPYSIYQLSATREGLVGGVTANGHIIKSTDIFVALPSRKALCSNNGYEFTLNITANGITLYNVPVWDLGPINIKDDYWNINYQVLPDKMIRIRDNWGYEGYGDITRGFSESYVAKNWSFHNTWSSSHPAPDATMIAYTNDSNPGTQISHTKINPLHPSWLPNTGADIDLSDEVCRRLGLGDISTVDVTFNMVEN